MRYYGGICTCDDSMDRKALFALYITIVYMLCPIVINVFAGIVMCCVYVRSHAVYATDTIDNKLSYDKQNDEHRYKTQK